MLVRSRRRSQRPPASAWHPLGELVFGTIGATFGATFGAIGATPIYIYPLGELVQPLGKFVQPLGKLVFSKSR